MAKIAVIGGVGKVGATTAFALLSKSLANELLIVDILTEQAKAIALDLKNAFPSVKIKSASLSEANDADIIIITAGFGRLPGMNSRLELLTANKKVLDNIFKELKPSSKSTLIVVTNPVDVLTNYVLQKTNLPKERVIGFGGTLDNARLYCLTGEKGCVIGEHGDEIIAVGFDTKVNEMLRSYSKDIISVVGATIYGPAAQIANLVNAMLKDTKEQLCVCNWLDECKIAAVWPRIIGKSGVEGRVKLDLTNIEQTRFEAVIEKIKELLKTA